MKDRKTEPKETDVTSLRIIFLGINEFIAILGLVMCGLGIWIRVDTTFAVYVQHISASQYYQSTYFMIAIGVVLFAVGTSVLIVGLQMSKGLLLLAILVHVVIIALEIAVLYLAWHASSSSMFESHITQCLTELINKTVVYKNEDSRIAVDQIQIGLKCCGGNNYMDYLNDSLLVPPSCYDDVMEEDYKLHGCGKALAKYLRQMSALIGGFTAGVMIFQLVAVIVGGCLLSRSGSVYTEVLQKPDEETGKQMTIYTQGEMKAKPEKTAPDEHDEATDDEVIDKENFPLKRLDAENEKKDQEVNHVSETEQVPDSHTTETDNVKQSSDAEIAAISVSSSAPNSTEKSDEQKRTTSENKPVGYKPPVFTDRKPRNAVPIGVYETDPKYCPIRPNDLPIRAPYISPVSSDV